MRSFLLIILLISQTSCAFITTAAGSFVGNLGADFVEEKIKQERIKKMFEEDEHNKLIELSIPF